MTHVTGNRVAVIGGGVAGLVSAKVLMQDGFDVTMFEKAPTPGGVWSESRAYPGLRTNNPRETYAFSDFAYPEGTAEFPTAAEVRRYLDAYARHFGLTPHIRCMTEVTLVETLGGRADREQRRYRLTLRRHNGQQPAEDTYHADRVVVCNGVFNRPFVPAPAGREAFSGQYLHSSQLAQASISPGNRVVVVGGGKSALDCALAASDQGALCTLVCRRPHWMLPRYFGARLRVDKVLFTRFSELLLPAYYRAGRVERALRWTASPLLKLLWKLQSRKTIKLAGIPPAMVPEAPLPSGIENIGIGEAFYQAMKAGRITVRRSGMAAFTGGTRILLDNGDHLDADLVVFATGWRQDTSLLSTQLRRRIQRNGSFQLYRHILPPEEPNLGFVGYASSSACPMTSELAAHWLSQHFRGELTLPDVPTMKEEIERVRRWSGSVFPARKEGYFIGAYIAHYADELLGDMGLRQKRAPLLREYFAPFWPHRYQNLARERQQARGKRH